MVGITSYKQRVNNIGVTIRRAKTILASISQPSRTLTRKIGYRLWDSKEFQIILCPYGLLVGIDDFADESQKDCSAIDGILQRAKVTSRVTSGLGVV